MSNPTFNNRPNLSFTCSDETGTKVIWASRSVAVCVLVTCTLPSGDRYVLIEQRGQGAPDFRGYFCLVCGYLDWDEELYQAALRETWEEAGLNLAALEAGGMCTISRQPIFIDSRTTANRQNVTARFLFELRLDQLPELSSENSEPDEIEQLLWMLISEQQLGNYKFCFNHDEVIRTHLLP